MQTYVDGCKCAYIHDNLNIHVVLFKGALRINPKRYKEAFIPSPVSTESFLSVHILDTITSQHIGYWSVCPCHSDVLLQDWLADIFLDGIAARNRALNGDVVVVKILPPEQWKVLLS